MSLGNGRKKSDIQIGDIQLPAPPFDSDGTWVTRDDYHGQKSYSFFICADCQHRWTSAHGWKASTQGCQKCETEQYPSFMWKNHSNDFRKSDRDCDESKAPHDQKRCGKCQQLGSPCWY